MGQFENLDEALAAKRRFEEAIATRDGQKTIDKLRSELWRSLRQRVEDDIAENNRRYRLTDKITFSPLMDCAFWCCRESDPAFKVTVCELAPGVIDITRKG